MKLFVGLDISLKDTQVCLVDADGNIVREKKVPTEPEAIGQMLAKDAKRIVRVGFEASSLSPWLGVELRKLGFPALIVEARHMKSALNAMRNKTDKNDARGIAQMMRTGWFREVHIKSHESHKLRILLTNRRMLKRKFLDIENAIRGTLKVFGVKMCASTRGKFEEDLREKLQNEDPMLREMTECMLLARRTLLEEFNKCHRLVMRAARENNVCRQFMTIPGVGPVTSLAVMTAIDDPLRFRRSKTVGAHFGLTPKRYQSGTTDNDGRISKCGDPQVRTLLVEAATSILCRVQKRFSLQAWGHKIHRRSGFKRAVVAVARKLAVIMHRMWMDGTEFRFARLETRAAA
ncbi:MAG: IS110 family transposase [Oricola sp.]|nr:IS110 family transposase [Oricola sp.]